MPGLNDELIFLLQIIYICNDHSLVKAGAVLVDLRYRDIALDRHSPTTKYITEYESVIEREEIIAKCQLDRSKC
jgi:hypothetical protein